MYLFPGYKVDRAVFVQNNHVHVRKQTCSMQKKEIPLGTNIDTAVVGSNRETKNY